MRTYNPRNIPLARHLRKNMTPWERKLWYNYLRNCPVRFQRQKAIGGYIADFYCASTGQGLDDAAGGAKAPVPIVDITAVTQGAIQQFYISHAVSPLKSC